MHGNGVKVGFFVVFLSLVGMGVLQAQEEEQNLLRSDGSDSLEVGQVEALTQMQLDILRQAQALEDANELRKKMVLLQESANSVEENAKAAVEQVMKEIEEAVEDVAQATEDAAAAVEMAEGQATETTASAPSFQVLTFESLEFRGGPWECATSSSGVIYTSHGVDGEITRRRNGNALQEIHAIPQGRQVVVQVNVVHLPGEAA